MDEAEIQVNPVRLTDSRFQPRRARERQPYDCTWHLRQGQGDEGNLANVTCFRDRRQKSPVLSPQWFRGQRDTVIRNDPSDRLAGRDPTLVPNGQDARGITAAGDVPTQQTPAGCRSGA